MQFQNRVEAGQMLAKLLTQYANQPNVLVLALPRGGVPVGHEVARALNLPLDLLLVRKLGVPGNEELAMGAIASGGSRVLNENVVNQLRIPDHVIEEVTALEAQELQRRERAYRDDRPPPQVQERIVILVDDGIATGATVKAAIRVLQRLGVARVVVATPTAALSTVRSMRSEVEVVAVMTPADFSGVGEWYQDFSQTSDEEVRELLHSSAQLPKPNS